MWFCVDSERTEGGDGGGEPGHGPVHRGAAPARVRHTTVRTHILILEGLVMYAFLSAHILQLCVLKTKYVQITHRTEQIYRLIKIG